MLNTSAIIIFGGLCLVVWGIIFWINKIIKKPTPQNQQGGGSGNTNTVTNPVGGTGANPGPNPNPAPARTPKKKFSWWNIVIGLGIIVLLIGFIMRMNTPYSQTVTIEKGKDYTFSVFNERITINPQVNCVHVIYPDNADYTFCPNVPVNVGEHGVGLYRLQATTDSQLVIISKEPLTSLQKFKFWINPTNWKLLFN